MDKPLESGFRFLEHTTDAEIEVYGRNLDESFENAGLATEETMVSLSSISSKEERTIKVAGEDLESLLYSVVGSSDFVARYRQHAIFKVFLQSFKSVKRIRADINCSRRKIRS